MMKSISLQFRSYIPAVVKGASGRDINIKHDGEPCFPLFPLWPTAFAAYATDNEDSARLFSVVKITFNDSQVEKVDFIHACGETKQYPGYFSLDRSIQQLTEVPDGQARVNVQEGIVNIKFKSKGANPFFNYWGVKLAPSIVMDYDISIDYSDKEKLSISITGNITSFPAHQISVSMDDKSFKPCYFFELREGSTPFHLFFGANKKVDYRLEGEASVQESFRSA